MFCSLSWKFKHKTFPFLYLKKDGGENILKTIDIRKSHRSFKEGDVSMEDLSTILWAGWGESHGKRTAPTAMNAQDITLYVFLQSGVYRYNEKSNVLELVTKGDFRQNTDNPGGFAAKVTNIAIVSDFDKFTRVKNDDDKMSFGAMSAAYVSENLYLVCAGLFPEIGTVTRYARYIDKNKVSEFLPLKDSEHVFLFQTIGYKR